MLLLKQEKVFRALEVSEERRTRAFYPSCHFKFLVKLSTRWKTTSIEYMTYGHKMLIIKNLPGDGEKQLQLVLDILVIVN